MAPNEAARRQCVRLERPGLTEPSPKMDTRYIQSCDCLIWAPVAASNTVI